MNGFFLFLFEKIAQNIKRLDISNLCGDTDFEYYYDYQNILITKIKIFFFPLRRKFWRNLKGKKHKLTRTKDAGIQLKQFNECLNFSVSILFVELLKELLKLVL